MLSCAQGDDSACEAEHDSGLGVHSIGMSEQQLAFGADLTGE